MLTEAYNNLPPRQREFINALWQMIYYFDSYSIEAFDQRFDNLYDHYGKPFTKEQLMDVFLTGVFVEETYVQGPDLYVESYVLTPSQKGRSRATRDLLRQGYGQTCDGCVRRMCVCDYSLMCFADGPHDTGCHGSHD